MTTFTLPRLDQNETRSLGNAGFGALQTEAGNLPLRQLGYKTRIVGLATRTTIVQTFYNPFDENIEAVYLFPIEGEQAVVDCEMRVADRIIGALLKERNQARSDYRQAIAQGRRAALLEENRPETFSMKVGNIAPGEVVQTRIETIGSLPVVDGEWTLRLPLVVAPRYTSGFPLNRAAAEKGTHFDTNQVPDASAVTPPTWLPGFADPVDLRLEVDVEMGSLAGRPDWSRRLQSSLHSVIVQSRRREEDKGSPDSYRVSVHPGERVDRDFILRGELDREQIATSLVVATPHDAAALAGESENSAKQGSESAPDAAFALHIAPPPCDAETPRDVVFVLDRSGSMGGWKMDAAQRGMCRLIDSLSPQDRFHVIAFDTRVESPTLSKSKTSPFCPASDANRFKAVQWLGKIGARGGTEMGLAIEQALHAFVQDPDEAIRSRAIVLVTDGQITGEDSVLRLLGTLAEEQRPRMFCLGVDRAVNGSVLQRLAKVSRGAYELVESEKRLDEVMRRFGDEIGSPAVVGLRIEVDGVDESQLQTAPANLPDLYWGRATTIYGRCPRGPLSLKLKGKLPSGETWEEHLISHSAKDRSAEAVIVPMWGRTRIRELEDRFILDGNRDQVLRNEIVRCSLDCNVLSRFTAYVAVDHTERVSDGRQPHKLIQPADLPEGWLPPVSPLRRSSLMTLSGRSEPSPLPSTAPLNATASPANFGKSILSQGIVSAEQLAEAENLAKQKGYALPLAFEVLGYASPEETARVVAKSYSLPYLDLGQAVVDLSAIELVPESVARENEVLPYCESGNELVVLMHNPADLETIEKLQFILNRPIRPIVASRTAIQNAINQYYGQIEGESADSMLQEFTDTAIDFCETAEDYVVDGDLGAGYAGANTHAHEDGIEQLGLLGDLSEGALGFAPPQSRSGSVRSRRVIRKSKRQESPAEPAGPAEAPVVRLVHLILSEAVQLRATHIILRAMEDGLQVVYLIDGKETLRDRVPKRLQRHVLQRLMVLAHVDPMARDQYQSGTLEISIGDRTIGPKVHFAASREGEIVMIDMQAKEDIVPEAIQQWHQRFGANHQRA